MAGYQESKARRARSDDDPLYPFSSLVISTVSKKERKYYHSAKLAVSRETAKRFFRFVTSTPATTDNTTAATSSPSARSHSDPDTPTDQGVHTEMQLGERGGGARPRPSSVVGGPVSGVIHRPSLSEDVRTSSTDSGRSMTGFGSGTTPITASTIGNERPIASANGISLSIALAEPVLYLQGFESNDATNRTTTMLRGSFHLKVSKSAKIKAVTLKFRGRAETDWPEGIPPKKVDFRDTESIMNHTWPFFNAQFATAEMGHGADNVQPLKGATSTTKEITGPGVTSSSFDHFKRSSRVLDDSMSVKDLRRLSLQHDQSRNSAKGEVATGGPTIAQKGYRTFTPGDYIYNFELPIDSRLPETIDVELGRVKYELEAVIERSGAFRANLIGSKEVTLIRAPAENSLETVEPIAISRDWEDQLHYDIVISGKSFPLGSQVPIAFKLTPLAKVQCHRIKVYITENIQYYTSNKRVHRMEPTRRIQLFEKRADAPSSSTYPGSSVRITAGGGVAYDGREAAARGDENVERDTTNLLGDLAGEHNVGPTEMEFNVQLPSCHAMQEKEKGARIHFDTTFGGIQVHHWIKIVMRLSKPDAEDSTKRRHFEISIDSPFHILSCRATQANIALPAYSSPESHSPSMDHFECGCPDAPRMQPHTSSFTPAISSSLRNSNTDDSSPTSSSSPTSTNLSSASLHSDVSGPTRPPAAHLHEPDPTLSRPIHLLRAPSFNPPAFSDSENDPPPPMITPPPKYESLVSGDPNGGLADYFARLADEVGDEEEDAMGRSLSPSSMGLPLTPGGRVNRSMDERRTWEPIWGR